MDVARFKKVCGLLGSEHDGERAAAALKATEILKAAGMNWGDIAVGKKMADNTNLLATALGELSLFRTLLTDERSRNTWLSKQIDDMKRENDRLRGQWPKGEVPMQPKKGKKRKSEETPEQASMIDYDGMLRDRVREALADAESGSTRMSERSVEFLQSVSTQKNWSDRQREAVEKTLRWFYADKT